MLNNKNTFTQMVKETPGLRGAIEQYLLEYKMHFDPFSSAVELSWIEEIKKQERDRNRDSECFQIW